MNYQKVYTKNYFSGRDSFFYSLGYGRFSTIFFNNQFKVIEPYLKNIKKGRILDVGCAYGFMLQRFPDRYEKYGIDVSAHAITEAKKRNPRSIFKISGAENKLPFPNNFFDVIICNDVLEHLENPGVALKNIHRILKPGGILYVNTPNFNWLRKNLFAYADKKEHHISLLSHQTLLSLLNRTGFKILDHYTFSNLTFFFFLIFRSNIGHESAAISQKI